MAEVKQFLCLMYGSAIRFYNTVLSLEILEQMKEDLIEVLTKLVFTERMSKLIMSMCKICTSEEETQFIMKVNELTNVRPT